MSECLRPFPPILSDNSYSTSVNSERGSAVRVRASYPMDKQWCGLETSLPHPDLAGWLLVISRGHTTAICARNVIKEKF